MFDRFTDRARKVVSIANNESQRLNHEFIGTEHLLLGIVREGGGVAANAIKNFNVDLRKIRLDIEKVVKPGPEMVSLGRLPLTTRAKKVIECAIGEARDLNHNYVGTEHLLLGLLVEHDGVAGQVLRNLGLSLDGVRAKIIEMYLAFNSRPPSDPPKIENLSVRPETGPMKFNDDHIGFFIRGDSAFGYQLAIQEVLRTKTVDSLSTVYLDSLLRLLTGSDETIPMAEKVQTMRSFAECQKPRS